MNQLRPAKKGQLSNYALFIASRWFESSDDYSNVERGCKRFLGNTSKFFYNPIPLTEQTREWFDHLQTLYIYHSTDMRFEGDERIQRRIIQIYPYYLTYKQLTQIEEWTGLKCKEILFDSDIDNWERYTSTFDSKIFGRSKLVFIVEDTEGNKFGGYIDAKIDKYWDWDTGTRCITDSKSFVFSLESNGRLNSMKKFNIEDPEYAFYLFNKSDDYLFEIGTGDISIYKKGSRKHYCEQYSFNYEGNQNTLCGKVRPKTFELKQFTVIQMK